MYTLISAIGKLNQTGSRWKHVSIGSMTLKDIFSTYKSAYAVLFSQELNRNVNIDLESIRADAHQLSITFNAYLTANGSKTLPEVAKIPSLKTVTVRYADAFHAGYTIIPVHPTASINSEIPEMEKTHIFMQKDAINVKTLYETSLISINGFLHLTDYSTKGLYVVDANKSRHLSGENQVGIHTFYGIGKLKFHQITDEMIKRQGDDIALGNRTLIKLPESVAGKTVMLSIGGYLSALDPRTYWMINDDTICIDFLNYPLVERYYESRKFIDLEPLGIEKYERNDSQVSLSQISSDEVITALLKLPQSFIIVLDSDELFVDRQHVDLTTLPGMSVTALSPSFPLVVGFGRLAEYWYTKEDGLFSLTYNGFERENFHFRTTDNDRLTSVCDSRDPNRNLASNSNSYFLLLGKDVE